MVVVVPESDPQTKGPKPKGSMVAVGVGALGLVIGMLGIGAMTAPDPVAVETTTTSTSVVTPETPIDLENFSIDQVVTGDPLEWEETKTLVEGIPIDLATYDGWIYLFATPSDSFEYPASDGLRVWRSQDGMTWDYLGEAIPPGFNITTVASTGDGLIAATADADRGGLVLWRSSDGETWESESIPVDDDPLFRINYSSVAVNDQAVVVSYWRDLAIDQLIETRMADALEADVAVARWGWGFEEVGDDPVLTLWGPFGFPLAQLSPEQLALTDEELEHLLRWSRGEGEGSTVMTRDSDGIWTEVEIIDAGWIDSISTTADGTFLANGGDNMGNITWTSVDGIEWQKMSYGDRPYRVIPWGDTLVGPTSSNRASVLASSDGEIWADLGPGDLFPTQVQWYIDNIVAGPAGILATVIGWTQQSPVDIERPAPPTVSDDGSVLTFDYDMSRLTLVAGSEVYTWPMNSSTMPEGISIDLNTGDISFSDPETGEPLAAFTFDQIQEAEESYWSSGWSQNEVRALLFSPDGEAWTVQDPVASFGSSQQIHVMEVGESVVVAVTYPVDGLFDPASGSGFSVWTAPIP